MTDGEGTSQILSREELDALLALLSEGGVEEEARGNAVVDPATLSRSGDLTPLQRGNIALHRVTELFGEDYSRHLSSLHQVRIRLALKGWEDLSIGDLTDLLLPTDLAVAVEFDAVSEIGFILLSRPLLFALLELSFGAQPGSDAAELPRRPYTGIEERLIRQLADEALAHFMAGGQRSIPGEARVTSIEPPARLAAEGPDRLLLATLEVEGLEEFSRVRFAIPITLLEAAGQSVEAMEPIPEEIPEEPMEAEDRTEPVDEVLNTPVRLRVEAGTTSLDLKDLSELQVGDVLPLETSNQGELVVRIEGHPKFRAVRGTVGKRLAIQVTERL